MSTIVAGPSSSCSVSYARNHSINSNPSPKLINYNYCPKSSFQGLSIQDFKRGVSNLFFVAENGSGFSKRGLEITARTAASKNIEVQVDKPLGLTLGPKPGGGVVITVSLSKLYK